MVFRDPPAPPPSERVFFRLDKRLQDRVIRHHRWGDLWPMDEADGSRRLSLEKRTFSEKKNARKNTMLRCPAGT